jgi:Uma2 family endonuclease
MSQRAILRMTADEFLEWDLTQPDQRHELVDGVPVAMTGASQRHDQVVVNTMLQLGARLRGGPCRLFTSDLAVRIPSGQIRRPDVGVHCGAFNEGAVFAAEPRLVVEVLSPSTRTFDRLRKVEEYKSVESLAHILLIDPDAPEVMLWSRDGIGAWVLAIIKGLEATADLPALGVSLRLADLYDGLRFQPLPRLVIDPPAS